ncbi:hypothetical protein [Nocardioides insulae]|uniref:hypothetical protein n=1 Tax=Nocardioides insulae TaxID=394734 RepID=UPI00040C0E69|nr:hypothetical protein [Nocardioides insulae]
MNKHSAAALTAALRDLDPAPEAVLTDEERRHADAAYDRIVATPHGVGPAAGGPRRRRWRLWVPLGLAAAAAAAIPALVLGAGSAFASWTPTPEPLAPAEATAAAAACRAGLGMPAGPTPTLVAERRGDWTYVLISEPDAEGSCLMPNDLVGQDDSDHEVIGSYDPDPGKAPTLAPDRIDETGSMASSTDEGWFRKGWLTWTHGYVGSDVTALTVHTPLGFDVEASVEDGRFAAWWPSDQPSSENLEVMEAWDYTVTLADGSTRHATG